MRHCRTRNARFKIKLFNPCKRIIRRFSKLTVRKPLCIRAFTRRTTLKKQLTKIFPIFTCLRPSREMDRLMELRSLSDGSYNKAPFPSPLTPAYIRLGAANKREVSGAEDIEDACRSFEKYLLDMIVEEGRMTDLVDVEELLRCWKNLKSPVFIHLVCRFYGELCKDLFSKSDEEE